MRRADRIVRDIRWGLSWSVSCGITATVFATLTYCTAGAEPFVRAGVSYQQMLGFYVLASLVFGVAVGLLRPWFQRRWGTPIAGMILAFLTLSMLQFLGEGDPRGWGRSDWNTVIFGSVLAGPLCAWLIPRVLRQVSPSRRA